MATDGYVLKEDRNATPWASVCRGDTQYARQIIGPDSEEQKKDDVPSPEFVQADGLLHNPSHAERGWTLHAETQLNAKAAHENKNHVHNGHMRLTEGWQLMVVKGSVSQIHAVKKEERDAKPVARSMYQIRKVQDMVKNCLHQTSCVFMRGGDATQSSDDTARRLILTPNPEVTMSLRESGPVSQSIPNPFFTQDNVELLEIQVSISSCGGQHVSGSIVRPGACWCEH